MLCSVCVRVCVLTFVRVCQIYPTHVTEGLRQALESFEERMPGFVCDEALLHGVETRTSAPVKVGLFQFSVSLLYGVTLLFMVNT